MFITVPLILIVASLAGIVVIVQRKMPYLRKLSPDAHQVGEHLVDDFFPELIGWFMQIKWHEYRQTSLREIEKLLRRMRLVLLKIDHLSDRLIKKIRRVHLTDHLEHTTAQTEKPIEVLVPEYPSAISGIAPAQITSEDLKACEQQLIIEISQDSKNARLYETLGDLYVKMENIQDAKEAYETALGFNPDNQTLARKYSVLLKKTETVG